jgi:hypothetical protein
MCFPDMRLSNSALSIYDIVQTIRSIIDKGDRTARLKVPFDIDRLQYGDKV